MIRFFCCLAVVALAACASSGEPPRVAAAEAVPAGAVGRTLVYVCDQGDFIARTGPGEIAVWLEDRYVILSQVRSASGAKYQEGDVLFWSKGDEAMLEVGDQRYTACREDPLRVPWEDARRRGVDFRAAGNEPGWHLEVRESDSLLFVGDYGATRLLFGAPFGGEERGRLRYSASQDSDLIEVTADPGDCVDTMQGTHFPMTVDVRVNERHYRGCGMRLEHPWE